ncbi:MAG: thioredoxin family protein [Candidatus Pacebacteria bacterium]|nr:thioredoxin family protein [Candidatus Paceibacterota bacterium]MBP9842702.1 thioredoxin family protein [Candidatus Paceibacterota bacterium]
MNSKVVIGIIGVLVVGLGVYGYSSNQKEAAMMEQKAMEEEKMMMEQKAMEEKTMMEQKAMEADKMMEKDGAMMEKDDSMMMSKGSYEMYDPSKLAMAEKGKVVLFFKASWCPSCRALDADIKASLADIPAGVTILEVDYDKSAELKQKYGVTMQHTLVQVDKDGNQITKWSGGATLEDVVKNIK